MLRPEKAKAFRAAAHGVQTWPRIVFNVLGGLALIGSGVLVLALIVYSYRRFRKPTHDVTARAGHIRRR